MTPTPMDKIRLFSWEDHKSALWWLGLLYRRSDLFNNSVENFSLWMRIITLSKLYLHYIPYIVLVLSLGNSLIFCAFGINERFAKVIGISFFNVKVILLGIVLGIVVLSIAEFSSSIIVTLVNRFKPLFKKILKKISGNIVEGFIKKFLRELIKNSERETFVFSSLSIIYAVFTPIFIGIFAGVSEVFITRMSFKIIGGILLGVFWGIVLEFLEIASEKKKTHGKLPATIFYLSLLAFISVFSKEIDTTFALILGITFFVYIFRIYHILINCIFIFPNLKGYFYHLHPITWDDPCLLPLPRLDRLLVAYVEHSGEVGLKEIERIISEYPTQRMKALKAKIILLAREAGKTQELSQLDRISAKLPEGEKIILKETSRIREIMKEISALQIRLNTMDRPTFREPYAQLLCEKIEIFRGQIGGFHEPLVSEFRKAAENWLKIARRQLEQAKAVTTKEPTPQVFRAGDPVNREQEAFVPRYGVMGELEKQVMLSTGCPGLVVYARRRMGKTTLLRNLNGFIPGNVLSVFNSMQNPELFTSLKHWFATMAQNLASQVPGLTPPAKELEDLPGLFNYLSGWNTWLEDKDKRILLEIDEYENIDLKIGEKVFPEDLLLTIRESIQSHRRITWIFAGSHEISELKHAPWTSYLVSARTLEVPMFSEQETRLLLTEPLKYSTLWEKDDPRRPRFAPEFWGEGGIERIHSEAGGWPHLVQLIAETIVDLLNDEDTREVNAALLERALDKAIVSGHNVLYELVRRECALPGEWEYLSAFRKSEFQPPPGDEAIYRSLRRRLLVAEENGRWRLRVPLMLRWLRQRG